MDNFAEGLKAKLTLIVPALFVSLFVYLFFRTEQTVVNYLAISVFGENSYWAFRSYINEHIQLGSFGVYSLPEALWILSVTLLSKRYVLNLNNWQISLKYVPLILVLGFEWFQFQHWANGHFDWIDLLGGTSFWMLGMLIFPEKKPKTNLFSNWNFHGIACILSYAIVYLAHVIQ